MPKDTSVDRKLTLKVGCPVHCCIVMWTQTGFASSENGKHRKICSDGARQDQGSQLRSKSNEPTVHGYAYTGAH